MDISARYATLSWSFVICPFGFVYFVDYGFFILEFEKIFKGKTSIVKMSFFHSRIFFLFFCIACSLWGLKNITKYVCIKSQHLGWGLRLFAAQWFEECYLTLSYWSEGSPALAVFRPLNCLKLTIPGFPHNCVPVSCGDIGFLKNPRSSIGLEIRHQSAFSAFRALLPSANYSAEWSGRVWQPSADSNGLLAHHNLSAEGCHTRPRKFEFN